MIKLSKKWSYAIKSIIYIASNKQEITKISQISKDLSISESLLRIIVFNMQKNWILQTIKWRNWWVKIIKNLKEINLYDILKSCEEDLSITECTAWIFCQNQWTCITTKLLNSLQKNFTSILKLYTLDKIIKKYN